MTDPVLALVLLAIFFALLTAASFFKTLDTALFDDARAPIIAGIVSGILIALTPVRLQAAAIGAVLTIAALYVRLTGRESEPIDGMSLGALTGAAAAIPLLFS